MPPIANAQGMLQPQNRHVGDIEALSADRRVDVADSDLNNRPGGWVGREGGGWTGNKAR